ncbi:MAG: lysylphosphatidylglycerol synthase domain-containing protein [candidate division Zixibacteria bacterium]|nr:lysylphosphatidylglycerol synthase domain-containing protein [candidate division Zixibacteria bacterium]
MDKTIPLKTVQNRPAGLDIGADQKTGLARFWSVFFPVLQYAAAGWFLWLYYQTIRADWGEIVRYGFHPNPLWFALGALLLFLGHSWQPAAFWFNFKFAGVSVPLRDSYKIYSMAHIAHYLPGRIWSYLSFAYLGKFLGIAPTRLLAALYLGFVASLLSGAAFTIFALPLFKQLGIPTPALAAFVVLLLVMFIPKVFQGILKTFGWVVRTPMAELPEPFGWRPVFLSSLYYGFSWLLNSAGVVLLVLSFHSLTPQQVLYSLSAFPLAYLAGYLAFFTAGGLGVREGVMLALLSAYLPLYAAATVPIVARVLTLTYEGVWFLAAWRMPWKSKGTGGKLG